MNEPNTSNSKINYALVTGASSGIGWHLSHQLAQRGYNILAVSNQEQDLKKLKDSVETGTGSSVLTMTLDLGVADAAEELYNFCQEKGLVIEVLINNAGVLVRQEVVKVDLDQSKEIMNLHMNTPVILCQLFGKAMSERRYGYILNISSISSKMPYPTISLYGPTKSFLRQFTKAFRQEMKVYDVHVTCLVPGATNTSLFQPVRNRPTLKYLGIVKEPEWVAKKGLSALFRDRGECIPGLMNKLILGVVSLVPSFAISRLYNSERKRKEATVQTKKTAGIMILNKISWDEVPTEEVTPSMARKIVAGEKLMIARMKFKDGFKVPMHSHENEQITHVISGTIKFWFGEDREQEMELNAGEMVVIPPNLPHEALMIGDVEETDSWAPPREDWLTGKDDYLRK